MVTLDYFEQTFEYNLLHHLVILIWAFLINAGSRSVARLDDFYSSRWHSCLTLIFINWMTLNLFRLDHFRNDSHFWEVVVAQLVERSLSLPEVRGSNPVIGKNLFISNICLLSTVYWKDENKEKEAGNGPFKKSLFLLVLFQTYFWLKTFIAILITASWWSLIKEIN